MPKHATAYIQTVRGNATRHTSYLPKARRVAARTFSVISGVVRKAKKGKAEWLSVSVA